MISRVEREHSTWNELPWKFEAGTNAIAEAIGLGAAIDYLGEIGMERRARARARADRLRARAAARGGGAHPVRARPTSTGAAAWCRSRSRACTRTTSPSCCDREAVCVRAGHHCAQPLMRCLGVGATARASFHVYNAREDVDRLVARARPARARCSSSDGRALSRLHPRPLQEPAELRRARAARPRVPRPQPALRRRAGRAHRGRGRQGRATCASTATGCAISQAAASITSEELIGMPVDDVAQARRRLGASTSSASTSPPRAASARCSASR